ncbi:MAG: hypothetical protein GXO27_07275 [Chlorobi bacterium]|nr:hypothetical protein [Chlorobiota bacterium]
MNTRIRFFLLMWAASWALLPAQDSVKFSYPFPYYHRFGFMPDREPRLEWHNQWVGYNVLDMALDEQMAFTAGIHIPVQADLKLEHFMWWAFRYGHRLKKRLYWGTEWTAFDLFRSVHYPDPVNYCCVGGFSVRVGLTYGKPGRHFTLDGTWYKYLHKEGSYAPVYSVGGGFLWTKARGMWAGEWTWIPGSDFVRLAAGYRLAISKAFYLEFFMLYNTSPVVYTIMTVLFTFSYPWMPAYAVYNKRGHAFYPSMGFVWKLRTGKRSK